MRRDQRSDAARDYHRLYKLARWCGPHGRRARQLAAHPLCAICLAHGRVTAATVADHIEPHRGDQDKFWRGELQSLCAPCHDATKQQRERVGYTSEVGADGAPLDPAHPFNR